MGYSNRRERGPSAAVAYARKPTCRTMACGASACSWKLKILVLPAPVILVVLRILRGEVLPVEQRQSNLGKTGQFYFFSSVPKIPTITASKLVNMAPISQFRRLSNLSSSRCSVPFCRVCQASRSSIDCRWALISRADGQMSAVRLHPWAMAVLLVLVDWLRSARPSRRRAGRALGAVSYTHLRAH